MSISFGDCVQDLVANELIITRPIYNCYNNGSMVHCQLPCVV